MTRTTPLTADPYWFLEASNGTWLKNATTHATTRDPADALSFPTRWAADVARQGLTGVSWMLFQPTEHMWLATEGRWSSSALARAYTLIEKLRDEQSQPSESGIDEALRNALAAIEAADLEFDRVSA